MDDGKIVQFGKHKDLIKKKGLYKELWDLQKGGFIEE
jgi:ABC-type multidrug transport system fused ATPase/permease subunit